MQRGRPIKQGRASPLASPKWAQMPKFVVFRRNFDQKPLKVCHTLSLTKDFQRQGCSAINYPSNGINILAGSDPVPVKSGPKGTDPLYDRCAFHVLHAAGCSVSDRKPCTKITCYIF